MKRFIVILLAASCVVSLCACPANTKKAVTTSGSEEVTATAEEETAGTEGTSADDTTDETGETADTSETAETTAAAPSESTTATNKATAKPTSKSIGKTKVTDALKKTTKNQFGKITTRIPKVTIAGVSTKAINKEMYNKLKGAQKYCGCNYQYYIGKTYVSIIVDIYGDASDDRSVLYNISRKTGKKMSRSQMLKALGLSSKKFESKTKKAIKSKVWGAAVKAGATKNKYVKALYNQAISKKTLKKAIPCVNSKGKVCFFVYSLPVEGGGNYYDTYKPI